MTIKANTDLMSALAHTETYADIDFVLRRRTCRTNMPMEALAANVNDGLPILRAEKACTLKAIRIIPGAVITEHDDNYATIGFESEDTVGAGAVAGSTAVATAITTKTTDDAWVQGTPIEIAGVADTDTLAEGQTLFLIVTKAGTGVALSDCQIEVDYELT